MTHNKGLCDFFQDVAVMLKPALKKGSKKAAKRAKAPKKAA